MALHQKLFLLLLLLLPTQLAYHFWPESAFVFGIRVDYLAPAIYLTDILVVLLLAVWAYELRSKFKIQNLKFKIIIKNAKFLFFIFYFLINVFIASNQPAALYKLFKLTELFLLGFYVSRTITHYPLPITSLSLAVIYSSAIGIAQSLVGHTLGLWILGERSFNTSTPGIALQAVGGQEFLRAYSIFSHPNSFAGFLLVACILLWPWSSFITRAAVVSASIAFILTFSQAAWLAAVLLTGFWLVRREAYTITLLLLVSLISLISLTSLAPLFSREEIILRLQLADSAKQMFFESPLFGVGLNNFVVQLPNFSTTPAVSWWLQPVHNVFLLVLAETGLVGLVFFLWFLYKTTHLSLLTTKPTSHYSLLTTALLAMLITGALDHYWLTLQQNQLLAALVLGLIFAHKRR